MTGKQGLAPRIIAAGQGTSICAFGIPMNVMLRAEETGGAFAALVAEFEPGQGPPPHFHHDHEEYFFVLEGEFELRVADQVVRAQRDAPWRHPAQLGPDDASFYGLGCPEL